MASVDPLVTVFEKIDILSWTTRTALELIGQSGLGYSFDPLTEDGNDHIFSKSAKELVYTRLETANFSY